MFFYLFFFSFFFLYSNFLLARGVSIDNSKKQQLNIDRAPNSKVDFININSPNKNGVSHNLFSEFNIDKNGLILNNSKDFSTSKLGGLIYGNPNFQFNGKEANLILNEVTGLNGSKLLGYLEITGKKADFILSNPNGIYLNGAGFINVERATLTTGKPFFNEFGKFSGFDVDNGNIVIGELGVDARTVSMFDIISRTAELSGAIYVGNDVNLILGQNRYNYFTKDVEKKNTDTKKPTLALDGKNLGSIYAGRIFLQSTEKGVGVNSQGEFLADISDLELDVDGDIVLKTAQAKQNINVNSKNLTIKKGISAENNINFKTKKLKNQGEILSNNNIQISSTTLDNQKTIASKKLSVNSDKIKNSGKIQGDNSLSLNSKELENTGGLLGTLTDIKNDNTVNTGNIYGETSLTIVSNLDNSGAIKSQEKLFLKGNLYNRGDIYANKINLIGKVENTGKISALSNLSLKGELLNNNIFASGLTLFLEGKDIINKKTLSSGLIEIKGTNFLNSGDIASESFNFSGLNFENKGEIYAQNRANFNAINGFKNSKLLQSLGEMSINSSDILNQGELLSSKNLLIFSPKFLNRGSILSEKNIVFEVDFITNEALIQGGSLKLKDVENFGTLLSKTDINAQNVINNKNISALGDISIEKSLKNSGELLAKGDMRLNNVETTGKILADGSLFFENLNKNSGVIHGEKIEILNKGELNNSFGTIKAFNNGLALKINADSIKNTDGELGTQGVFNLSINSDLNLDEGKYFGNRAFNIRALNLNSENDFENTGDINIELTGDFSNKNRFVSRGNLSVSATNLETHGTIGSVGITNISLKGFLKNLGEMIFGSGKSNLTANKIQNQGFLISNDSLDIASKNLENSGQLAVAKDLKVESDTNIRNNEGALIFSGGDMRLISKKDILNNKAEIYSGKNMILQVGKNVKNIAGTIEALNDISIKANNIQNIGELQGDYTKKVVPGSQSSVDISKLNLPAIDRELQRLFSASNDHRKRWRGERYLATAEEGMSNLTANMANIKSAGNINLEAINILNREGNIIANKDINIKANSLENDRAFKDIDVTLTFARNYRHRTRWGAARYSKVSTTATAKQRLFSDKTTNITAGENLNIEASKVGNGVYTTGTVAINKREGITNNIIFNNKNDLKKDGVIKIEEYIELPKGDKGLFKINEEINTIEKQNPSQIVRKKNPKFGYLIETNINFIDKGHYLGSEYFFNRINFNPETDVRVLGDSFYENMVVNKAIFEATGKRYLNNTTTEKQQMETLFNNSVEAMKDLNLSVGIALTKEQIDNLKSDIIWYVEEEINGIKTLVPKVYLSKETLASLNKIDNNQLSGNTLNINAITVNNTGNILGRKDLTLTVDALLNETIRDKIMV